MKKRTTFLMVLVIALALTIGPAAKADSVRLDESGMAALVGGDPYCALGYGISAGLAIGGTLIALTGGGAPVGAGIRIAGMLLGLGVHAACS